jgi:hypothetical protein
MILKLAIPNYSVTNHGQVIETLPTLTIVLVAGYCMYTIG